MSEAVMVSRKEQAVYRSWADLRHLRKALLYRYEEATHERKTLASEALCWYQAVWAH